MSPRNTAWQVCLLVPSLWPNNLSTWSWYWLRGWSGGCCFYRPWGWSGNHGCCFTAPPSPRKKHVHGENSDTIWTKFG
jgi:hypothetical protein